MTFYGNCFGRSYKCVPSTEKRYFVSPNFITSQRNTHNKGALERVQNTMREKIKKEGNFPVLILKFNTAWYLIIILWHLCPWVNLHNRLWQILPDQSVLPRSWTLEGSAALWFWKGHALQRPGTEGVTAVAEPQQTDHLAARVDKGAPEAWQETHKHWYLPGGGGG